MVDADPLLAPTTPRWSAPGGAPDLGQSCWQGDLFMLRIAQLAPPFVPVPPTKYGGTERVVSLVTEELVRRGHSVTLFASGDSSTSAALVPTVPNALWGRDMTNP